MLLGAAWAINHPPELTVKFHQFIPVITAFIRRSYCESKRLLKIIWRGLHLWKTKGARLEGRIDELKIAKLQFPWIFNIKCIRSFAQLIYEVWISKKDLLKNTLNNLCSTSALKNLHWRVSSDMYHTTSIDRPWYNNLDIFGQAVTEEEEWGKERKEKLCKYVFKRFFKTT